MYILKGGKTHDKKGLIEFAQLDKICIAKRLGAPLALLLGLLRWDLYGRQFYIEVMEEYMSNFDGKLPPRFLILFIFRAVRGEILGILNKINQADF
jgi:hypothetical protein